MLVGMNKTSALCLHIKEKFYINMNWSRKEERAAVALVVLLIRNGLEMELWLGFGIWAREYLIVPSSFFPALICKKVHLHWVNVFSWWQQSSVIENSLRPWS